MHNLDSLGNSPLTLKLDTGVGKQGRLQAEGLVQLSPTAASLTVATRNLDMRVAQAHISPFLHLELRSGLLSSDLDMALSTAEPLALRVQGKAQVTQLHTLDTLKDRDLLRWKQLDLGGIDYRHGERLDIERVDLDQPYARFIINEDLTTNLNELIIKQPADWAKLSDEERRSKLHGAVLASWSGSRGLQRQLAQARAAAIKAYLVDNGKLADERIYLLDVNLGQPEPDDRVAIPLHLGSE